MPELVEVICGALLVAGATYVVYRLYSSPDGSGGLLPPPRVYGTIPLPENVESWLYVKNPEPRGAHWNTVY